MFIKSSHTVGFSARAPSQASVERRHPQGDPPRSRKSISPLHSPAGSSLRSTNHCLRMAQGWHQKYNLIISDIKIYISDTYVYMYKYIYIYLYSNCACVCLIVFVWVPCVFTISLRALGALAKLNLSHLTTNFAPWASGLLVLKGLGRTLWDASKDSSFHCNITVTTGAASHFG